MVPPRYKTNKYSTSIFIQANKQILHLKAHLIVASSPAEKIRHILLSLNLPVLQPKRLYESTIDSF